MVYYRYLCLAKPIHRDGNLGNKVKVIYNYIYQFIYIYIYK